MSDTFPIGNATDKQVKQVSVWLSLRRWAEGKGAQITATKPVRGRGHVGNKPWTITYAIETGNGEPDCSVTVTDQTPTLSIEAEVALLHELEARYNAVVDTSEQPEPEEEGAQDAESHS